MCPCRVNKEKPEKKAWYYDLRSKSFSYVYVDAPATSEKPPAAPLATAVAIACCNAASDEKRGKSSVLVQLWK